MVAALRLCVVVAVVSIRIVERMTMGTDATKCAKCGGEFSRKRIYVQGTAYHEGCVIMSYPSHTPADMEWMNREIERLRAGIEAIKLATIEGRVCDDVAWFDTITTLHDFCDELLNPETKP